MGNPYNVHMFRRDLVPIAFISGSKNMSDTGKTQILLTKTRPQPPM